MTKPIDRDLIYRRRGFDADIIELCRRWHITYRMSYRDLAAIMAERGVQVSHTTLMRWTIRYDFGGACSPADWPKRQDDLLRVENPQMQQNHRERFCT